MSRQPSRRRSIVWTALVAVAGLIAMGCSTTPPSVPWRGADCGPPPTIASGASLYGCNLAGALLSGVDLSGADLRGAVLTGADLSGANLTGADLTGANLTGANLTGANLTEAVLAGAILIGAIFASAILSGASFDFGTVYGSKGLGGGKASGSKCTGDYCPGFNQATVDNGHPLCNPNVGAVWGDWFYVHRTEAQLAAAGKRSVVVDGSTSFAGAVFDFSDQDLPAVLLLRGINWSLADFSGAQFIDTAFGCQSGTGARFGGATFTSTGVGEHSTHWYAIDLTDSDFSASRWVGVVMSTTNFTGSNFASSEIVNWALENQLDFDGDGEPDNGYVSPYYLLNLSDTDFSFASLGLEVNPGTGHATLELSGEFDAPLSSTSFAGANLTGAHIANAVLNGADFSGVTSTGTTMTGPSLYYGANFTGDWSGSTWVGPFGFDSTTTCPDGSAYDSVTNVCLPPA